MPGEVVRTRIADVLQDIWSHVAQIHELGRKLGGTCPVGVYVSEAPLGLRNVRAARALLGRHHVPVVAEDVGETYARKLQFEASGGCVSVQPLRPARATAP